MKYEIIRGVINRPVLNGFEFDYLMPSSNCDVERIIHGKGREAHKEIVETIKEHYKEAENISKSFVYDKLSDICIAIQNFLHSHIQYSYNDKYNVKTPACVWSSKQADCKSYTVFASCILINLGIKHYLRSVYYSGRGGHIYVVVPVDQNTGNLNEKSYSNINYHTIDGTSSHYFEQHFAFEYFRRFIDPENIENTNVSFEDNSDKKTALIGLSILATILIFTGSKK